MKRNKNKLGKVKNKIRNISTLKQNQNVVIHLAKPRKTTSKTHNLRATNAPIIRYYTPTPQPSQHIFQTNKTLESIGNTLRELKHEQTVLRNEMNTASPPSRPILRAVSPPSTPLSSPLKRRRMD